MRIALAQINSTVGDFEANLAGILNFIKRGQKEKVDLVVFPELALCGYPPEDLLFKKSFIDANGRYLHKVKKYLKGDLLVILGYVARQGKDLFNAAAVLNSKKVLDIYHKIFLPNYGVFDEKRYFAVGREMPVYLYEDLKLSLTICEDVWRDEFFYALDRGDCPEILINISASPFFAGKFKVREQVLSGRARRLGGTVFYCNLVGGQDELVFDGTSLVVNSRGQTILRGKRFEEDFIVFDGKKKYKPQENKIDKVQEMYKALILGIKDYVRKNNFKKVLVGVSGGIDSAITLALAEDALGQDNVLGLIMPSKYTSPDTLSDAVRLCASLGIQFHIIPIDGMHSSYLNRLNPHIKNNSNYDIACQNLQARIRGNILMGFSNRFGYLVLNTGNKSEISVGYCTLYGDMVGGFGVLKDVYKSKVYKLANFINKRERREIIPSSIIKRAPSAELKPNQRDEDDIPPYRVLDRILKLYIEEDKTKDVIMKLGFKKSLVNRVVEMVDKNEYKRRQSPPGIKITPKAFGRDRRMPITNQFRL